MNFVLNGGMERGTKDTEEEFNISNEIKRIARKTNKLLSPNDLSAHKRQSDKMKQYISVQSHSNLSESIHFSQTSIRALSLSLPPLLTFFPSSFKYLRTTHDFYCTFQTNWLKICCHTSKVNFCFRFIRFYLFFPM